MGYFLSKNGKDFAVAAGDRHPALVTFWLRNFFTTGMKLHFYNGITLLGESASISPSMALQEIATSIDLTGVSVLTVKTSAHVALVTGENFDYEPPATLSISGGSGCLVSLNGGGSLSPPQSNLPLILANALAITPPAARFPGLSMINFRWLPTSICPDVVAGDFDVPANVVIDADGIGPFPTGDPAVLPFVYDHVVLLIREGLSGHLANNILTSIGSSQIIWAEDFISGVDEIGIIAEVSAIASCSFKLSGSTILGLAIEDNGDCSGRIGGFLLIGWNNP